MATLSFWTKIGQLAIDVAIIPVFVSAHLNKNIAISVFNIHFLFVLNLFYTIERQKKTGVNTHRVETIVGSWQLWS